AGNHQRHHGHDAENHFASARPDQAEIFCWVFAGAAGKQRQQHYLDRRRNRDDDSDGGAVAAEIRQMTDAKAVPISQRNQRRKLANQQSNGCEGESCKPPPGLHRACLRDYGINTTEPVVLRPSRSLCDCAASLSAYVWVGIFTAPEPTTLNRSLAMLTRSSRLAA